MVGCMVVLGFGDLYRFDVVFNLFGGIIIVFGYTTAIAIEEYPETWGSGFGVLGVFWWV